MASTLQLAHHHMVLKGFQTWGSEFIWADAACKYAKETGVVLQHTPCRNACCAASLQEAGPPQLLCARCFQVSFAASASMVALGTPSQGVILGWRETGCSRNPALGAGPGDVPADGLRWVSQSCCISCKVVNFAYQKHSQIRNLLLPSPPL